MPVQKLSDDLVATLSCPEGRAHIEYFDTLIKGLYVDVLANGRIAFRVRYRQDGKKRAHTLGNARLLTVAEARVLARNALRKVIAGGDPKVVDFPIDGPTIEHFYIQQYLPYVKSYKRSWDTDETMIRNHLVPALGDRAMGCLIPPDIARLVDSMKTRGYAAGTINRVLVLLRYGYTLAIRWRIDGVNTNPAKELRNLKEDNKIERYLSPEQTTRLLVAVRASRNPLLADIVAFLLFTGARKREALDARWQDIDWRQKLWRIPRTKSGKVRHVHCHPGREGSAGAERKSRPDDWAPLCQPAHRPAVRVDLLQLGYGAQRGRAARATHPRLAAQLCQLSGQRRSQSVRGAGVAGARGYPYHQPLCPPEPRAAAGGGGGGAGGVKMLTRMQPYETGRDQRSP